MYNDSGLVLIRYAIVRPLDISSWPEWLQRPVQASCQSCCAGGCRPAWLTQERGSAMHWLACIQSKQAKELEVLTVVGRTRLRRSSGSCVPAGQWQSGPPAAHAWLLVVQVCSGCAAGIYQASEEQH